MERSHTSKTRGMRHFQLFPWHLGLGHLTEFSQAALSTLNLGDSFNEAGTVKGFQGCGVQVSGMVTSIVFGKRQWWLPTLTSMVR